MMRQKIAKHMVFSKQTSAHVTTVHKVDFTKVAKTRDKAKGNVQAQYGFSLTFLPFVKRAVRGSLRQFPILNASIDGTNIIYHRDINLGIAVALENGLIVPVIRNADEKSVIGLQRSVVGSGGARPVASSAAGRGAGRDVLHHQFRQLRQRVRDAGDQSAAGGDSGRRHGGERCRW